MTVKNFWMDAVTREAAAYYFVIPAKGREWQVTRAQAADFRLDPSFPADWRVERRVIENTVPACPWCGARPELFEMDCDGLAATGTCGSEQCDQLRRCEGCGKDGVQIWGSWRGRLCDPCHTIAERDALAVIPGVYGLHTPDVYREYYNFA